MNQEASLRAEPAGGHTLEFRLRRGRNWFFLGLLYAGYYLCRYNISPIASNLADALKLSNEQVGRLSTGRDIGYAIGQLINGLFADALGGKRAMMLGAFGTVVLNLLFGWFSLSTVGWLVMGLVAIRTVDGYIQSFGAPGMVKINTSWFQRRERGKFAGIFGGMIQLGYFGVLQLGGILVGGLTITALGMTLEIPKQDWRIMFVVPPILTFIIMLLAWMNVKDHPEDAGFSIPHDDDDHGTNPHERLPLATVFRIVASNPIAWLAGGAYLCTGFVRRSYDYWWAKYLADVWGVPTGAGYFFVLGFLLPLTAFIGSFSSGWISDTLFKGRRSPVAALLYGLETVVIVAGVILLSHTTLGSPLLACIVIALISLTCNSSHSIIGTAVAMDIGGRKASGFALGIVNFMQYVGATLAGSGLGKLIDDHGWDAFFYAMIPFSTLGTLLMAGVWLATRGRDVKGA